MNRFSSGGAWPDGKPALAGSAVSKGTEQRALQTAMAEARASPQAGGKNSSVASSAGGVEY